MPIASHRSGRAARVVFLIYFAHGFLVCSIIPRVPEFIERIQVDFATWGLVTGLASLGSMIGLTQTNRFVERFGSRRVNRLASLTLTAIAATYPFIRDGFTWFLATFAFGIVGSFFNVSINSQAVALQKLLGRVVLGRYHAAWSIGAASSAAISGLLAPVLALEPHFTGLAVLAAATFYFAGRSLLHPSEVARVEADAPTKKASFFKTPRYVWLLTAGLFLGMFPEAVMMDWSANYAKRVLLVDATLGALPYTVFVLAMIAGRLSVGRLTKRYHFSELSKWGGIFGSLAMLAGLLFGPPLAASDPLLALTVTLAFWAIAGLGVAPMVPSFFSASGYVPGMSTADVMSRMSLANSLIVMCAKYAMGWLAANQGLQLAMLFPIATFFLAGLVAAAVAKRAKKLPVVGEL